MTLGRFGLRRRGYEFPPFRPPSEAESLLLRVTRGCPWNRCTFCSMYKGINFEIRDVDEVIRDMEVARNLYRSAVRSVFIGDSDSLVVKKDRLLEILDSLYAFFPAIERVTSYARAKTLSKKPDHELVAIRDAGLTRLHVGMETGDEELMKEIRKGVTPEEMVEAGVKAKRAGFEYSLYVLLGIGGEEKWEEHARKSANLLNRIGPHFIRLRTFIPMPGSALYDATREGRFSPPPPETILKETKLLLENVNVETYILSDHVSNLVPLEGKLPAEKKGLIEKLEGVISRFYSDREFRQKLEGKRFRSIL